MNETAVDESTAVARRCTRAGRSTQLVVAGVEHLQFPAANFDTVLGTRVFCSVFEPVTGLREAARRALRTAP
jgi:ubiquinone/menaquinone biosynthesis C-methylase UbiE